MLRRILKIGEGHYITQLFILTSQGQVQYTLVWWIYNGKWLFASLYHAPFKSENPRQRKTYTFFIVKILALSGESDCWRIRWYAAWCMSVLNNKRFLNRFARLWIKTCVLRVEQEYVIYFLAFLFSPLCRHLEVMKERNMISLARVSHCVGS